MVDEREAEWFDEFWQHLSDLDEDDQHSAVRLLGELFRAGVIFRHGDYSHVKLTLDAADQVLIQRMEDAAEAAERAVS